LGWNAKKQSFAKIATPFTLDTIAFFDDKPVLDNFKATAIELMLSPLIK
jgi:hypothetical protein